MRAESASLRVARTVGSSQKWNSHFDDANPRQHPHGTQGRSDRGAVEPRKVLVAGRLPEKTSIHCWSSRRAPEFGRAPIGGTAKPRVSNPNEPRASRIRAPSLDDRQYP
jgi:hypothetical protein